MTGIVVLVILVVIALAIMIYGVQQSGLAAPWNGLLILLICVLAALIILQKAGVLT